MLLVAEPAALILRFIQILCWIILPLLTVAWAITSYLHFKRRKSRLADASLQDQFINASPELVGYTNKDGEMILFDHSPLIIEYKKRLLYNNAKFMALQKDFIAVKKRYETLTLPGKKLIKSTTTAMENLHDSNRHENEKSELIKKIEESGKAYESLEQENRLLLDQIRAMGGSEEEKNSIALHWAKENETLRDKVLEQEYLKELMEAKNAEIRFLQQQIEQRIKGQHLVERNHQQVEMELEKQRNDITEKMSQLEAVKNDLLLKEDQLDKMQVILCGKDEMLEENQRTLKDKADQLIYSENVLREIRSQNELLTAELSDTKDREKVLQTDLENEKEKVCILEQKLRSRKQLLQKIHQELSASIQEAENPKVVSMTSGYPKRDDTEVVFQ